MAHFMVCASEDDVGVEQMCPYCGSNQVHSAVVDPEPPIVVHYVCERCSKEWVE